MTRKIIIFGNGLGMAIDPVHFSLSNALAEIWNSGNVLDANQKELISRCTESSVAPEGEHELDQLHLAISSCATLNKIGSGKVHWLSENGQDFPKTIARYIHKVASRLHNYEGTLPHDFSEPLLNFIRETKSHVCTLNYDKLLYNAFIDNEIVGGYNGFLADGMIDRGFSESSLERRYGKNYGYYLHLHGSPLFVDQKNSIIKLARHNLDDAEEGIGRHIVLTHVKHKPAVISASEALSVYWRYLRHALEEAEEIILFGYSGMDNHLNDILKPYLSQTNLKIIEWEGAGSHEDRILFWKSIFSVSPNLIRFSNITEFTDW